MVGNDHWLMIELALRLMEKYENWKLYLKTWCLFWKTITTRSPSRNKEIFNDFKIVHHQILPYLCLFPPLCPLNLDYTTYTSSSSVISRGFFVTVRLMNYNYVLSGVLSKVTWTNQTTAIFATVSKNDVKAFEGKGCGKTLKKRRSWLWTHLQHI